jgi:hypothetical protein
MQRRHSLGFYDMVLLAVWKWLPDLAAHIWTGCITYVASLSQ